jgi:chemotaxis signal transduction protein
MLDLRTRLNIEPMGEEAQTIVVVVFVRGQTYGLRADSVSDVMRSRQTRFKRLLGWRATKSKASSPGSPRYRSTVLILLDLDRVVGTEIELAMAA